MKIKFFDLKESKEEGEICHENLYFKIKLIHNRNAIVKSRDFVVSKIGDNWFKFSHQENDSSVYVWAERINPPTSEVRFIKCVQGEIEQFLQNPIDISIVCDTEGKIVLAFACADSTWKWSRVWFAYATIWATITYEENIIQYIQEKKEVL